LSNITKTEAKHTNTAQKSQGLRFVSTHASKRVRVGLRMNLRPLAYVVRNIPTNKPNSRHLRKRCTLSRLGYATTRANAMIATIIEDVTNAVFTTNIAESIIWRRI
jgi:hypothetical protein